MKTILLLSIWAAGGLAAPRSFDVVVYGCTSGAVTAAIQTKKMGKTVVMVCPERHLGGLTAGGLGWTDSGNKAVIGGFRGSFTIASGNTTRNRKRGNGRNRPSSAIRAKGPSRSTRRLGRCGSSSRMWPSRSMRLG